MPTIVDKGEIRKQAEELIKSGEWAIDGKNASITIDDAGLAKAIISRIAQLVVGATPRLMGNVLTTKAAYLASARDSLSRVAQLG